jgi:hypothetical protein
MNSATILCGEDFLRAIPVESTRTYTAIPHGKVIDDVRFFLNKNGLHIKDERYTQCADGKIAQGNYTIYGVRDPDMCLQLAWQNSTNKQVSFKLAVGTTVFVCTNSAVWGDLGAFKRIHKGDADSDSYNQIERLIGDSGELFMQMVKDKDVLKEIEISKTVQAELIGRMFLEEEILTMTQLGIIKREIENPSFDYGCPGSVWELYQHCTHSFKEITPRSWMTQQMNCNKFIREIALV